MRSRGCGGTPVARVLPMIRPAMCLLLAACGGQPSSTAMGVAGVDAAGADTVLGSLSDTCEGDSALTGQQALTAMKPRYAATYTPSYHGGPSSLTLDLAYQGGLIVCHPA